MTDRPTERALSVRVGLPSAVPGPDGPDAGRPGREGGTAVAPDGDRAGGVCAIPGAATQAPPLPGGTRREDAARRLLPASPQPALDQLCALAARLLGAASAQVSLLTDVQTVAAGAGGAAPSVGEQVPVAGSLCTVTAAQAAPLVVDDARADVRVAGLPPVATGAVGSYLGAPLRGPDGLPVGALCVYDPSPREWSEGDVALLENLAGAVTSELELAALAGEYERSRVRWDLAIEAAGIGSFDWDVRSGRLSWDARLLELFGYAEGEFPESIEGFNARVHPDDLPRTLAALDEAVERCGVFDSEYRVVLPGGETRWVAARGRALCDERGRAVRVVGAAYDTTSVRGQDARVARVLETMSAAFYSLDREWRFTYVNGEAERLLGRPRDELLGGVVWELYPAAEGEAFGPHFRRAAETGEPVVFDAYYPAPLDRWYEMRAWPSPDGLSVYFLDITERRAVQQETERSRRRAELLAEVTASLAGTLDVEEAVARLAHLVVPALADWCLVTLVGDDESLVDVGWWHADPALREAAERYAGCRLGALTEGSFVHRALRTGRPAVQARGARAAVEAVMLPGQARDLLEALDPESIAVLPLRGRGRTVGLLTLFTGRARGPLGAGDLVTAEEVAGRAGLALDNARLYSQQRRLAEGLQRSLLTEPPEPDHVEVAVRYEPAAEAAQVGGDWYDAFVQPDGATVLVIGDVVGHDFEAAAAMGQLRGLLRGIAFTTGEGPAGVLARLDAAMEGLQVETTATAVVARVEQTPEERDRGTTRVRWSNAGHPPPMVVDTQGRVDVLGGEDADLLLGIDPALTRGEHEVVLERGCTLLLYTDGLVERREQGLDEGLDRLRAALAGLADLPLPALCDAVLARLLPASAEDDVALVAVRLHPQDQPRPAGAGPRRVPPGVPPEG